MLKSLRIGSRDLAQRALSGAPGKPKFLVHMGLDFGCHVVRNCIFSCKPGEMSGFNVEQNSERKAIVRVTSKRSARARLRDVRHFWTWFGSEFEA